MSTPDMADVARLVNADDPPAEVAARVQATLDEAQLAHAVGTAIFNVVKQFPIPTSPYAPRPLTPLGASELDVGKAALTAMRNAPGYALVRLPEPTEGEDGDRFWHIGRRPDHTVLAAIDRDGTPVGVDTEPELEPPTGCPSTHVYERPAMGGKRAVQCKHAAGHDGPHAATEFTMFGDLMWTAPVLPAVSAPVSTEDTDLMDMDLADQPDGIDDQTNNLPDPAAAAERIRAYVSEWGDGRIDVLRGQPLYARDLEAVTRGLANWSQAAQAAGDHCRQVEQERDQLREQRDNNAREVQRLSGLHGTLVQAAVGPWDMGSDPSDAHRVAVQAIQGWRADWESKGCPESDPTEEQWCVWYGGEHPDDAAGRETRDDQADAEEALQWFRSDQGSGIAVRTLTFGPWRIVKQTPAAPVSSVEPEQPTAEEFAKFDDALKSCREPAASPSPVEAQPDALIADKERIDRIRTDALSDAANAIFEALGGFPGPELVTFPEALEAIRQSRRDAATPLCSTLPDDKECPGRPGVECQGCTTPEPAVPEQAQPRVWTAGDPEPDDRPTVRSACQTWKYDESASSWIANTDMSPWLAWDDLLTSTKTLTEVIEAPAGQDAKS